MNNKFETDPLNPELDRIASMIAEEAVSSDIVEKMKTQLEKIAETNLKEKSWLVRPGILKWTSAAALVASFFAVIIVFSSNPANVFAQMQEALAKATTIQMNKRSYGNGEQEPYHSGHIFIDESNRFRMEEEGLRVRTSIVDPIKLEMMNIWPEAKKCVFHPIYDREGLERQMKAFLEIVRFADAASARRIGSEQIGNQEIVEYEFASVTPVDKDVVTVNIFVNASTRMPVKIIENYQEPEGRTIYDNIVFGEVLDPKLFEQKAPEGFEVIREARIDDSGLILSPGIGLGDVKFGMHKDDIKNALGSPSFIAPANYWTKEENAELDKDNMTWCYERGFRMSVNKDHGVYKFVGGVLPAAQPFQGVLPGGIRLGATREEVEKVFGTLYDVGDDESMDYHPTDETTTSFRFTDGGLSLIVLSKQLPEDQAGD